MDKIDWSLLAKYFDDEVTDEERNAVEEWLAKNPEWAKTIMGMKSNWNEPIYAHDDIDKVLGKKLLKEKLSTLKGETSRRYQVLPWKVAASIALICLLAISAFLMLESTRLFEKEIVIINSNKGDKKVIRLSDGSVVYLNACSELSYQPGFGIEHRKVSFKGEGFFNVTPNAALPFSIQLDSSKVRVVGTSFNVNTYKDATVTVVTGLVKFGNDKSTVNLKPNQKARWNSKIQSYTINNVDIAKELAWKENSIIFSDTSLKDAAQVLERWYNVEIIFENDAIRECLVTGKFSNESLKNVLRSICFSNDLEFEYEENKIKLLGMGCIKKPG